MLHEPLTSKGLRQAIPRVTPWSQLSPKPRPTLKGLFLPLSLGGPLSSLPHSSDISLSPSLREQPSPLFGFLLIRRCSLLGEATWKTADTPKSGLGGPSGLLVPPCPSRDHYVLPGPPSRKLQMPPLALHSSTAFPQHHLPTPQPARVHLPQPFRYRAVTSLKWFEVIAGTFLLRIFQ